MKILTITLFFLFCFTFSSHSQAEYQSGYNPKEEYSCRYSSGEEKFFAKNKILKTPYIDVTNFNLYEMANIKMVDFSFKFAVNGDLILIAQMPQKLSPLVYFYDVVINNSDIIVAYDTVTVNDLSKVVIFKSGNKFNSVFSYDGLGKDEGKDIALSFSFPGTCKRKNIS